MEFIHFESSSIELGNFTDDVPQNVYSSLEEFMPLKEILTRFSSKRSVTIEAFEISKRCMKLDDILDEIDDLVLDEIDNLDDLCTIVNSTLKEQGYCLPSEDQLEYAFGGTIFPWGNSFPQGIPYNGMTDFQNHNPDKQKGLLYNPSTYSVELVNGYLKMGDGGEAVCGEYPWPIPWLSLSPSWHLQDSDIADCFWETLEEAEFRVVKL